MARLCVALLSILVCVAAWSSVNVGIVLDTQRSASAVIETTGGTLTATAADGTIFTMTFPAKALLSSERITMTPVAQVDRLPFSGGLIAAVQLEPAGLRLWNAARLTIATPVPIPAEVITPMAWHGGGHDLYLYPLVLNPNIVAFDLMHFSGIGVGNGTDAERQAQLANFPCDAEAALTQRLGYLVRDEYFRQRYGDPRNPELFYADALAIVQLYYDQTIKPLMASALQSKDDDILYSVLVRLKSFEMQMAGIFGDKDPFPTKVHNDFTAFLTGDADHPGALKIMSDNAFNRCTKEHKPEEIQSLLRIERIRQYLGLAVDLGTQQKVDQCGSFELVFDSLLEQDVALGPYSYKETMHATSTVPLHYVIDLATTGNADLLYDYKATLVTDLCSVAGAHGNGDTFHVLDVEVNLNAKQAEDVCSAKHRAAPHSFSVHDDATEPPKFEIASMTIDPGSPSEAGSINCPQGVMIPLASDEFVSTFGTFHVDEKKGATFKIKDWSTGTGGALIARKTYQRAITASGGNLTEVTTLDLFHRP